MDAVRSRLAERITSLTRHARNIGLCPHRKNPRFYRNLIKIRSQKCRLWEESPEPALQDTQIFKKGMPKVRSFLRENEYGEIKSSGTESRLDVLPAYFLACAGRTGQEAAD